ncbi:NAD(P)H-hydrate dehydratase [Adhaeribacter soli]|uniref:Bifunctional NAD(P)H-hydrate repair enzyme n=1 Tax=Adhaeribacter soli TaxID=2607655 RepID=A0A5N1ISM7_9BACT|nr:NAD(P)H-hydrate dehydratase [Adhaeribacter soli]KAA9331953.1 NAD(P)H-hydrate dehydratase [Adhaeribacter soli]
MKILTAAQLREADAFTIEREKLGPGELMERAATAFVNWYTAHFTSEKETLIFCGPGNNGGDGLAIARLLHQQQYPVRVFLPETGSSFSADFSLNLERLPPEIPVQRYESLSGLPHFEKEKSRFIDALFGTGLNRPLTGLYAETIAFLNASGIEIIAVDVPSGLFTDSPSPEDAPIIQATYTVSFEMPKLAFLLPKTGEFAGDWQTVPIGLNQEFIHAERTPYHFTTEEAVSKIFRSRPKFSHKGTFGHALLMAGSYGKMGAAVLTAQACLRSGVGLLSVAIPECGYQILQISAPEAMVLPDPSESHLTEFPADLQKYSAIGIGPGIGQQRETRQLLSGLLDHAEAKLILDADALNLLAADKKLLNKLPPETILTPHPKEFERLAGSATDDFQRLELLREFCERYRCYVVLKGAYSCIGTPSGNFYFNSTGNPGMATGGSGDALTGIITALRAQHYPPEEACILGVYLHGLAGDLAKAEKGETALIAGDIIAYLGKAFQRIGERATEG